MEWRWFRAVFQGDRAFSPYPVRRSLELYYDGSPAVADMVYTTLLWGAAYSGLAGDVLPMPVLANQARAVEAAVELYQPGEDIVKTALVNVYAVSSSGRLYVVSVLCAAGRGCAYAVDGPRRHHHGWGVPMEALEALDIARRAARGALSEAGRVRAERLRLTQADIAYPRVPPATAAQQQARDATLPDTLELEAEDGREP